MRIFVPEISRVCVLRVLTIVCMSTFAFLIIFVQWSFWLVNLTCFAVSVIRIISCHFQPFSSVFCQCALMVFVTLLSQNTGVSTRIVLEGHFRIKL